MINELHRPSSWVGKVAVLAVAVLALNFHSSGAPERALAAGGVTLVLGVVLGLGMLAIVVARLVGRDLGLIRSDLGAIVTLLVMVAAKIAIARVLLPV